MADFFYSLPCLHVSILRKDNDGNDFKDGNIAWEGGSGVITDFLEREALIQKIVELKAFTGLFYRWFKLDFPLLQTYQSLPYYLTENQGR